MAGPAPFRPFAADGVRGFLHEGRSGGGGLVLTHGAGSDCTAPLFVTVAEAFAAAGVAVLRCDLAFRIRRPKGPPSPATAAADRDGLRDAVAALRQEVDGPAFLGGHSYGGRQASMLAADDPGIASALLLMSYPLHPPGQPERLRTEHFPRLTVPTVLVHGPKDGFATSEELAAAVAAIPAPTRIIAVEGAGHDLKRGRFPLEPVVEALVSFGGETGHHP